MCGAMAGVWCPTFMCVHTVKEATGAIRKLIQLFGPLATTSSCNKYSGTKGHFRDNIICLIERLSSDQRF